MDKKEIQKQRMIKYFVDAAKTIIREEGVKAVTTRKVADLAGYSYATIYNYFTDLDTLLLYCIADFLDECYEYVKGKAHPDQGLERIKSFTLAYLEYFVENPRLFHMIFVEEITAAMPGELQEKLLRPKVAVLLMEELEKALWKCENDKDTLQTLGSVFSNYIHGKLLFYFKREQGKSAGVLKEEMGRDVDFLLDRYFG